MTGRGVGLCLHSNIALRIEIWIVESALPKTTVDENGCRPGCDAYLSKAKLMQVAICFLDAHTGRAAEDCVDPAREDNLP